LGIANQEILPGGRRGFAASDIVQETFLEAHRDFATFFGQCDRDLRSWLRRMLLHNLVDLVRRHQESVKRGAGQRVLGQASSVWQTITGIPADDPTPSACAMASEKSRQLRDALQRLRPDHCTIIILRYQQGLSFEEAAVRMDRSVDAVRKLWIRGIQRLRELLEEADRSGIAR
jgi:RNA polymerase sigma-70 factor (ECF subfamily)